MMDIESFWIILVNSADQSTAPNPAGFFLAVPTLEMAKLAVRDEVNIGYPKKPWVELEWSVLKPYRGIRAVAPCGDVWILWQTIMTYLPEEYMAAARPDA